MMRIPQPKEFPGVVFHDDITDFANTVAAHPAVNDAPYASSYDRWPETLRLAREGTTEGIEDAQKLVEELTLGATGNLHRWAPDRAGAFPIVPEFLANSPTPMRRRTTEASEVAPLTVWVGSACSSGTSRQAYQKRGVVLMALVMMLIQQGRPVRLMVHTDDGVFLNGSRREEYGAQVWEIPTRPLNLGLGMFALSSQDVEFTLTAIGLWALQKSRLRWPHEVTRKVIGEGWTGEYHKDQRHPKWIEYQAQAFGGSVDDLWIPAPHLYDPITKDPLGWLKEKLAEYGSHHTD